ncbi:MAG: hypothetical protein ACOCZ8_05735 [Bacteroidota bacterium]
MPVLNSQDPNVEVSGALALSFIHANEFGADLRREILEDNGIEDPSPESWHPWPQMMGFLEQLESEIGERSVWQLGVTVINNIEPPKPVHNIKDGLEALDLILQATHRGGDIGHSKVKSFNEAERFALLEVTVPYPTIGLKGYFTGLARKSGEFFDIKVDVVEVDPDNNANRIFKVSW